MASEQTLLEYLTTTKIGEKGQVTVPKQFRENLGLGTGAPLVVLRLGDGLILMPQQERFERLCSEISSALTANGILPKAVLATLPKARERIFERRYGRGATEETALQRRSSRSRAK
jgi:AbrB family looped-hinge helix DNA binding protein